jgi:hypothetical protein
VHSLGWIGLFARLQLDVLGQEAAAFLLERSHASSRASRSKNSEEGQSMLASASSRSGRIGLIRHERRHLDQRGGRHIPILRVFAKNAARKSNGSCGSG